jgi:signal transduction histidine kinase
MAHILIVVFIIFSSIGIEAGAAETRHILLVHAFGHPYSPWSDMAGSFRAELMKRSSEPIELHEVSLDTARVNEPQQEQPFIEYIRALLAGRHLDLLVPVGAPAAFFMQRYRQASFPSTRMLIMGADIRRIPDATLTENDAAVVLGLDLTAYLENILRLRPETSEVAVVVGNSPVERFWTSELRRDFQPFADRVNLTWFNDLTFAEMLAHAAAMPAHSAIFYFLLSEDAAGVTYSQDRALEKFREVATAPIFGVGDYELGRGIVGGPLIQTQVLGQQAADIALRILAGEKASAIKTSPVLFGAPTYDWRELHRWDISEAKLPAGSIVQFREASVWVQYRWAIILIAAALVGQTLLIAYVLFQNRRRRAAEAEAAEQRQEVTHLMRVSVLGELSGAIAHEINQPLTAILSNAQAALHMLGKKPPDLGEVRDAIRDIVEEDNRAGEVIHRLRKLLRKGETRSEQIDLNDLVRSTVGLFKNELIDRRIEIDLNLASGLPVVSGDPVQLQQVLLNLVMNAMDAMASTPSAQRRIAFSTRAMQGGAVELRIRDRGAGIGDDDPTILFKPFHTSKEQGLGLGLAICSSIVQAHGGKLTLANHEEGGAVAVFRLPAHELLMAAQ